MHETRIKRLIIFGLPLFLGLVTLLSVTLYRYARRHTLSLFKQQQVLMAMRVAEHLQDYLHWLAEDMEKMVPEVAGSLPPGEEALKKIHEHLCARPVDTVFIDPSGVIRAAFPPDPRIMGLDMSSQEAFRKARGRLAPEISGLYRTVQGGWGFHINMPLTRNGRFEGVVGSLFPLEPVVARFLAPMASENMGVAWVIDQDGKVIFADDMSLIGLDMKEDCRSQGRLAELEAIKEVRSGRGGLKDYRRPDGRLSHMAYQPVRLGAIDSSGFWGLAVITPQAAVLASIRWLFFGLILLSFATAGATVTGAFLYVRQQKESLSRLRDSNESLRRFSHAMGAIREAVIMTDLEGLVVFANEAAGGFFQADPGKMTGMAFGDLLARGIGEARAADMMERSFKGSAAGEVWSPPAQGYSVPALLSSSLIPNDEGSPYLAVFILTDVSDLKRAEAEVNRRRLELESHLYTISHDLKTPLITIRGYSDVLIARAKEGLFGTEEVDGLERIRNASVRMNALISQILEMSRAGMVMDRSQKIPFGKVVEILRGYLESTMEAKGITFLAPADFPQVYADPERLTQVMDNLLTNAVKFSDPGRKDPTVEVGWREEEKDFVFFVRDNGQGIEPDVQEMIFEPFYHQGRQEGSGIGLAIVKRIVEEHGGRVWVESTPGEGSTFLFTLPKAPSAAAGKRVIRTKS